MRRGVVLAGRYELDEPIGRGGMGEVWRAFDQLLDRRVAVKLIASRGAAPGEPDEDVVARFRHEARNTAWLEHPGVPTVYDFGTYEGRLYLVMQYVDGITVGHLIGEQGPLPVTWAALIAAQVCAVLGVAHRRPLVHRDLKPSNLMLCRDGSVKVLDFGVAVGLAPDDVRRTATGAGGPGSPGYTAPEQLYGSPGPSSDLYSLGCVLYEMLTGCPVFTGDTCYAVQRSHEQEVPLPVVLVRPEVPPALDALVLELLEKLPEHRPRDAVRVYDRLMPFVGELQPLGDVLDPDGGRISRLYGATVGGISLTGRSPRREPPGPVMLPTREDLRRRRGEAAQLASDGRYAQAADLLSPLVEPAALAFGEDDTEVVELRLALADALFEGGDHRRAASAIRFLITALTESFGPSDERVARYREREADCHARLGDTERSLRLLEPLAVERPHDDDLRAKMARLYLADGRSADARLLLTGLPPDHPMRTFLDGAAGSAAPAAPAAPPDQQSLPGCG